MHHRHAVLGQQVADRAEELLVLEHADMLEHADRDDPVEAAGLLAIVAQLEPHPVGQPAAPRALAADLELMPRERDAEHLARAGLGEIEREPAPARADVEHALAGAQQQLGREMALLVLLRRLQGRRADG